MTSTNFLKSLTITAAALGSKFGVPVYVGGQTESVRNFVSMG